MKLQVVSDLHLECEGGADYLLPETDADVVVLAGDIHSHTHGLLWAARTLRSRGHRVVYVTGNHELYHAHAYGLIDQLREVACQSGIDFLENDVLELDGVRILGTVLWTDFQLHGTGEIAAGAMRWARGMMNDFRLIRSSQGNEFSPAESVKLHRTARAFLETELAKPFVGPSVVVSHHAPHTGSVHERFKGTPLSPAFASDLSSLIAKYQPALWLHGHMHDSFDYRVGETRVVCNPRGYAPDMLNPNFDPALILEV